VAIRHEGETLVTRQLRLDAGETVTATERLDSPGEYEFESNDQSVTGAVEETGGAAAGESGPGFGVAATVLAVASLPVAYRRE